MPSPSKMPSPPRIPSPLGMPSLGCALVSLRSRLRAFSRAVGLGLAISAIGAPGVAWADQAIELRWTHAAPSTVSGFRVHSRTESGTYDAGVDVGIPAIAPDGRFTSMVSIPEGTTIFIRVSAYNAGGSSPLSTQENSYLLEAATPLGKPGKPFLVLE